VSAGNLDQLNYAFVEGNRVADLNTPPQSLTFPLYPWVEAIPFTPLASNIGSFPPEKFIETSNDAGSGSAPDDSASWIRGFIEPPQTGAYTFWVAGTDDAEFWISTTPGSAGVGSAALEAFTGGGTGVNAWAVRFSQKSRPITLTKGTQYYFALLQKNGSSPGGLAQLGWWLPDFTLQRPIPLRYAQRFVFSATCNNGCTYTGWTTEKTVTAPIFQRGPGGATVADRTLSVTEGQSVDLSTTIDANYPVVYQWYSNGVAQVGATTSAKYIESISDSYDNSQFYIVAGAVSSKVVTVRVTSDTSSPSVVFASTSGNNSGFSIVYSENVDPTTATNKANYAMNNGVVIDKIQMLFDEPKGNTVVVTTTAPLTAGGTLVTINNVTDASTAKNPIPANTQASVALTDGIMTFRAWGAINGGAAIGGTSVQNLLNATNRFPNQPDVDTTVTQAAIQFNGSDLNFADNYGGQLIGFVVPPVSGNYNFAFAADDQAILYLSTDATVENKRAIAVEPQWRGYRNYLATDGGRTGANAYRTASFPASPAQNTTKASNQSKNTVGNINLTAGNKYFIEGLFKEGGGGDNLDITWQLPNTWNFNNNDGLVNGQAPIPGQYLSLFVDPAQAGPIVIQNQPLSTSVVENRPVQLNVVHAGSPSHTYQWYRNGVIIPDQNKRELVFARPLNADNQSAFTVAVRNLFSQAISAQAILTVITDVVKPTIVRAIGSSSYDHVTVEFDELVDPATATSSGNYSVSGLTITGGGIMGGAQNGGFTTVTFPTSPQTPNTVYTVTVNNVTDIAETPNAIAVDSTKNFTGFISSSGVVNAEIYRNIGGTAVSALLAAPNYPNAPDEIIILSSLSFGQPNFGNTYGDNFGLRIAGVFTSPGTGNYRFFTRSDDAGQFFLNTSGAAIPDAKTATPIAREDGCCAGFQEPPAAETSGIIPLVAGNQYGFVYLVKEGGGGDWGQVALRQEGDSTPANQLQPIAGTICCSNSNPDETAFTFNPQITGGTFSEGTAVTFTTGGSGTNLTSSNPTVSWSWQAKAAGAASFTNIPGAFSSSYTTPRLLPVNDQTQYRAVGGIPGLSSPGDIATLTVVNDIVLPTVTNVSATPGQTQVRVTYSEVVDPTTSVDMANYVITAPGAINVPISAATQSANGTYVTLTTAALTPGTVYSINVSGVKDTSFAGNTMTPAYTGSFTAWTLSSGLVRREMFLNLPGGGVNAITNSSKYPNNPDRADYITAIESPDQGIDNFGTKLSGYLNVPQTGVYYFAVSGDDETVFYLSTDSSPDNVVTLAGDPQWNGFRNWNGTDRRVGTFGLFPGVTTVPVNKSTNTVGGLTLTQGVDYYFQLLSKEGGGGDNCGVTWNMEGQPTPDNDTPGINASNAKSFVNPDNTINISAQPQSVQVTFGGPASVSVAANPTAPFLGGPISYQWYKDSVLIPGATGTSVSTTDVQAANLGSYYVVMNAPGAPATTSATAVITAGGVQPTPTLSIVNNGNNTVTVSYPNADKTAGAQLQGAATLADPLVFTDDNTGAVNGANWDTTKATGAPGSQTYWRTKD